jgi:DNA-binding SARP family transcriptional activator/tetratricopeptide (TPR) repeat protein
MRFGILGPLLVHDGDTLVVVPAARQRVLLAALLVHAGQAVPADELAEVVWDGAPPAGAITTLRSHVMRLRRVLGPAAGGRVVTRYPGYLVEADEEEVDLLRFALLSRDGGAAVRAGAWTQASDLLGEALGLWRGAPLTDIPSELLRRDEVPGLEQQRIQSLEWWSDARLQLGCHDELVPELQALATQYPLQEHFHAQLMLALYRCGRQAEALAGYQAARKVLVEELGAEPGPGLQELHQRMLAADPSLAFTKSPPLTAAGMAPTVPRELPAEAGHFIGRAKELAALTAMLDQVSEHEPGTLVISAIDGTAGVGKTALTVHWAHQVAARFPDGQLHVNLRGYDPEQPMTPADALAGLLRSLGVSGQDIPTETDERAARYRSLLAGKQMLVVVDNASDAEQVRPLLPGTPGCAVVVTSRDSLAGLVARHGARRLDLGQLPLADAISLLRALIGARLDSEPEAAMALAGLCCRLPLALRVTAELAAARPAVPIADLVRELSDQQQKLDLLDAGGDPRTAVRTVFSWSYRHLDADSARQFRLVSLHPAADMDAYAAAALAGISIGRARRVLDMLARAHLIQYATPGRYEMHDLLRAYGRDISGAEDGQQEQRAALLRLVDYYLHAAAVAMDTLFPAERDRRPRIPPAATPAPRLADLDAARVWLDTELASLVAVTAHAANYGWPEQITKLAATLARYLDVGGYYPEAVVIHGHARLAAGHCGDRAAEARALTGLGVAAYRQARYSAAVGHLEQAQVLYRDTGDHTGEARVLTNLGLVVCEQGLYQQAVDYYRQAVAAQRQTGDRVGVASALDGLGIAEKYQGHYQEAAIHHQEALAIYRDTGERASEAFALGNLGSIEYRQGHYQQATDCHRQALVLFREFGDRAMEARALGNLGSTEQRLGHYQQAIDNHRQALALSHEIGNRIGEAESLNALGEALLADARPTEARARHVSALSLTSKIGSKYQQARAHDGLGHAYHVTGELGRARLHWQEALALYTDLGVSEADEVRAQLATDDSGDHPSATAARPTPTS